MEGTFPRNADLNIVRATSTRTIYTVVLIVKNETQLDKAKSGYSSAIISNGHGEIRVIPVELTKLLWTVHLQNIKSFIQKSSVKILVALRCLANHISMLKRSLSMEFDSDQIKSGSHHASDPVCSEAEENGQSNKKMCHSPEKYEDMDGEVRWNKPRKVELYGRVGDGGHVTQSKSIFSHENSCIYGNPKDDIKGIEHGETAKEVTIFESGSANALDLSCKGGRPEDEKPGEGNTYQNYHKSNSENAFQRSNLHTKLVSSKKPSIPEQLQIAKIQQQQRRSIQQQQKLIQQMRRSLDPTTKSSRSHQADSSHKKYFANSTNQEQNDLDHPGRNKDDYQQPLPGSHFPQYSYFEPGQHKELPDGHPILPLLDPVYFSALYNAHGFLPPSSPSIAAAFIGTLQDALPKLPLMFPSTSANSSILPQKSNDNHH